MQAKTGDWVNIAPSLGYPAPSPPRYVYPHVGVAPLCCGLDSVLGSAAGVADSPIGQSSMLTLVQASPGDILAALWMSSMRSSSLYVLPGSGDNPESSRSAARCSSETDFWICMFLRDPRKLEGERSPCLGAK